MATANPERFSLGSLSRFPFVPLIGLTAAVCVVTTFLGFLGSAGWLFDLLSHFRAQYALALTVGAGVMLHRKEPKVALCLGSVAFLNAFVSLPMFLREPGTEHDGTPATFRAVLVNVNLASGNPERVAAFITKAAPDVLILEEVNEQWLIDLEPALAPFGYAVEEPRKDNFGIAVYSILPLIRGNVFSMAEDGIPSIVVDVETSSGTCTILATHAMVPLGGRRSRMRDKHLKRLAEIVKEEVHPLIVMGSLNTTPWSAQFRRLIERSNLHDGSRGYGLSPTWPAYNPLLMIPIDHCLHSGEITIADRIVGPRIGSDHFPLTVDVVVGYDTTAGSSLK